MGKRKGFKENLIHTQLIYLKSVRKSSERDAGMQGHEAKEREQ